MKKLLFSALIVCSINTAMSPEQWLVERKDGQKLNDKQLQKISNLDNSRGCPETNWKTIVDQGKYQDIVQKIITNKAGLIVVTHNAQLAKLKKIKDLQVSLVAKKNDVIIAKGCCSDDCLTCMVIPCTLISAISFGALMALQINHSHSD